MIDFGLLIIIYPGDWNAIPGFSDSDGEEGHGRLTGGMEQT
jgi:hypothetical protein